MKITSFTPPTTMTPEEASRTLREYKRLASKEPCGSYERKAAHSALQSILVEQGWTVKEERT